MQMFFKSNWTFFYLAFQNIKVTNVQTAEYH